MVSLTPFRPSKRTIMQRYSKGQFATPKWTEYHRQTDSETPDDLEHMVTCLRAIFPSHEFEIR